MITIKVEEITLRPPHSYDGVPTTEWEHDVTGFLVQVTSDDNQGVWQEEFTSRYAVGHFIRGVKAGAAAKGDIVHTPPEWNV